MAKGYAAAVAILSAMLVLLLAGCASNSALRSDGRAIVTQSGGQAMLLAQCKDWSYVENTSDYIVEGEITSVEAAWVETKAGEGRNINTFSNFTIGKYLKGKQLEYDKIRIVTGGGCVAGMCQNVEDSPAMAMGKKRLYLREFSGDLMIHGCGGIKSLESG